MKIISGASAVIKSLKNHKVKNVFAYTGGAIMPVIDELYKQNMSYVLQTHEQSLGHAATGYAKSLNGSTPGICMVTSGPGLTNLITPITDAQHDSTPLIVFSGQVPTNVIGTQAFQECPSIELTKPITKWSHRIKDVNTIKTVIDKAFRISLEGKPGVVHIDLPKDIITSNYENIKQNIMVNKKEIPLLALDTYDINEISSLINNSKKPVIIAGKGCISAFKLLRRFAVQGNIPVTTTIHGLGIFDETHRLSLQMLGMHGHVSANKTIQNADLIINIGSRFDDRTTGNVQKYAPKAYQAYKNGKGGIIHVNIEPSEFNKNIETHFCIQNTSKQFIEEILPKIEKKKRKKWFKKIKYWKDKYPFTFSKPNNNLLNTQIVIHELNNFLKNMNNYFIATGVGNHQMMVAQYINWKNPNSILTSGSLGVMGTSLPYAIGAQFAHPNHTIISIDGDGSFNHTMGELKTIADYNLPIKIAIMNDGEMSMVKAWEHLFFEKRYAATNIKQNLNYSALAESFGITSMRCSSIDTLNSTLKKFIEFKGPVLCDFRVQSDLCLPLVKPGNALDDMIIHGDKNINNLDTKNVPS